MTASAGVLLGGSNKRAKATTGNGLLIPATVKTYTAGSALTITIDGSASAVKATMGWDGTLSVGDRVWATKAGAQYLVTGRMNAYGKSQAQTVCDFYAYSQTNQNIPTSGSSTKVNLPLAGGSTYGWDTFGSWNTTTSSFTCVTAGKYEVAGAVYLNSGTATVQTLRVAKNGTETWALVQNPGEAQSNGFQRIQIASGDVITLAYLAFFTGTLNITFAGMPVTTYFTMRYEGP